VPLINSSNAETVKEIRGLVKLRKNRGERHGHIYQQNGMDGG
jgi:hypothetical protein